MKHKRKGKEMNRDRSYGIQSANNGFVLNVSWWHRPKGEDDFASERYISEQYIFADWTELVKWLHDNKLENKSSK